MIKKKSITVFVFIVFPSYQIDNHIAIFGCGSNYRKILNIDSWMKLSTGGGGLFSRIFANDKCHEKMDEFQ